MTQERPIGEEVVKEMFDIIMRLSRLENRARGYDFLEAIFALQRDYQQGSYKVGKYPTTKDEAIYKLCTCIIHEATELQRLTNALKWWKKDISFDENKAKEELIDIVHFVIHLAIELDMTPQVLFNKYWDKNAINRQRIRDNY